MIKQIIEKLIHKQNLDSVCCEQIFTDILENHINPMQAAAFLVLLRAKVETAAELTGMMSAMKKKMIHAPYLHKVLDIVGTGGDGANTINISTGSAILAASCGIKIAKHGNRSVSSLSGSADVLEKLGININLSPEKINQGINEIGIGFYFSPNFHPALHHLRDIRKQLNIPTTFNLLGPLLNPAQPSHMLVGVFNENLLEPMAISLKNQGIERALVFHGSGLDEINTIGPIQAIEINQNTIHYLTIDPQLLGFQKHKLTDLQGGNAEQNAAILLNIFNIQSKQKRNAISDTLILNTAAALYLYGHYTSITDAISHATEQLYTGAAFTLLKKWIEFSYDY